MLQELSQEQVQISLKVDRQLRDEFSRAAASEHLPMSHLLRDLMQDFIDSHAHEPNEETIAAIEEARSGRAVVFDNLEDLFHDLGIPCEK